MKHQIPAMIKSKGGSVINMASILGTVGEVGVAGYVASKHGVVGLTKTGALEYAKENVRVNAIGPGYMYTGLVNEQTMGKMANQALETRHALHRLGEADEIAFLTRGYAPLRRLKPQKRKFCVVWKGVVWSSVKQWILSNPF